MRTAVMLFLAVLAQAVGNTCLSKGMKEIGAVLVTAHGVSPLALIHAIQSPMIWVGMVCLVVFFAFYAALLSREDLSFVLPATSFGYILNIAFASHFLNESISPSRWAGTVLIIFGVVLVSRSAVKPSVEMPQEKDRSGGPPS